MKHLLSIKDMTKKEVLDIIKLASEIKKHPKNYSKKASQKVLLMIFEAPSLRTRVSFETAMIQIGGSAINYSLLGSPLGHGKETIEDTAKTISRYVNLVTARLYSHENLVKFAKNSSVPVINAMTNFSHPCQILGDLLTIQEKKKKLKGLNVAYLGDCNNNVTNSLLFGCSLLGLNISLAYPNKKEFSPSPSIIKQAKKLNKSSSINIYNSAEKAVKNADIIYTDSFMSYRIPKSQKSKRIKILKPFQVNKKLFNKAPKALFMHCLPASRGQEVTNDVMDSKRSIVFDQAENRLHIQKAIILKLLK